MNNEKKKPEEAKKLEELTKQNALDTERTRKAMNHQGKGLIPSEWENLMGLYGGKEEIK